MITDLQMSFKVGDGTDVLKAAALTLAHFGCGTDRYAPTLSRYEALVKPDFTLEYLGFRIPVSLDDTAATLVARILAYTGRKSL